MSISSLDSDALKLYQQLLELKINTNTMIGKCIDYNLNNIKNNQDVFALIETITSIIGDNEEVAGDILGKKINNLITTYKTIKND
jgi:hypothetical protein